MIHLRIADRAGFAWCQHQVTQHHYLHAPVDSRCSPLAYLIELEDIDFPVGCLIVGRPESTRCYDGKLTYGSLADVRTGRCAYSRWEVLNLARVWLSPRVQRGGDLFETGYVPLFVDRRNVARSTLASDSIRLLLGRVNYDYLRARPPVYPDEPYQVRVLMSYCDTRLHKGTIYQAAGFEVARVNAAGIQTWYSQAVAPLSSYEDDMIRKLAGQAWRSRRYRARRAQTEVQERFV
jgi:hypothetical protein